MLSEMGSNDSNRKNEEKFAEKNIAAILKAVEVVRGLSIDASAIRLKLDELLRLWERKWYLSGAQNQDEQE